MLLGQGPACGAVVLGVCVVSDAFKKDKFNTSSNDLTIRTKSSNGMVRARVARVAPVVTCPSLGIFFRLPLTHPFSHVVCVASSHLAVVDFWHPTKGGENGVGLATQVQEW